MIFFILFAICAPIAVIAFVGWLFTSVVLGLMTSAEKSLTSFSGGRVVFAVGYAIVACLFLYAIGNGLYLAFSFITTVFFH